VLFKAQEQNKASKDLPIESELKEKEDVKKGYKERFIKEGRQAVMSSTAQETESSLPKGIDITENIDHCQFMSILHQLAM
jgi:hypothetical protein